MTELAHIPPSAVRRWREWYLRTFGRIDEAWAELKTPWPHFDSVSDWDAFVEAYDRVVEAVGEMMDVEMGLALAPEVPASEAYTTGVAEAFRQRWLPAMWELLNRALAPPMPFGEKWDDWARAIAFVSEQVQRDLAYYAGQDPVEEWFHGLGDWWLDFAAEAKERADDAAGDIGAVLGSPATWLVVGALAAAWVLSKGKR